MSGTRPLLPDLPSMRVILSGARALGGPYGTILELCLLTMCLPWEAAGIELAEIDWSFGEVPVPARGGARRILHLPPAAIRSIKRVAGSAIAGGQAVTGGRGRPVEREDIRLDRVQARLAAVMPESNLSMNWNFHGVRAATARELFERGCNQDDLVAALGIKRGGIAAEVQQATVGDTRTSRRDADRAAVVVGKWNAILAGQNRD